MAKKSVKTKPKGPITKRIVPAIEQELRAATGLLKPTSFEQRHDFLGRLIVAAHKLDLDKWEVLSNEAQLWANDGAEAVNNGKPIADFEGAQVVTVEPKEPAKPKPKRRKSGSRLGLSRQSIQGDGTGIKNQIKKLVLDDPSITKDNIILALEKRGVDSPSPMTVGSIKSEFKHSILFLKGHGYLKDLEGF